MDREDRRPPYFGAHRNQAEKERAALDADPSAWRDWAVTRVLRDDDGGGRFEDNNGTGTGYPPGLVRRPQVGDMIRVYGTFGSMVRGAALHTPDGLRTLWFRTQTVMAVDRAEWQLQYETRQHENFERQGERLDREYEKLPPPLRRRIDRFRAEDPDFRWREEAYEMAAVAEAARLYRRATDPAFGAALRAHGIKAPTEEGKGVRDFERDPERHYTADWEDTPENRLYAFDAINSAANGYRYELMREIMPEMDDGHSGNTWAHAFAFARELIRHGDEAQL